MTNKKKKILTNEKGFTLIEIIAVIIIMGILAAVAVPKFFDMQEDAKRAALNGALSEAAARFNHAFARYILDEKLAPTTVVGILDTSEYLGLNASTDTGASIGDFNMKWEKVDPDGLTITVMSAATLGDALFAIPGSDRAKSITGVNWGS